MTTATTATARHWPARVLTAATVVLTMMRFVHIEADFPAGITASGMLYTDEGWYANAAVRHTLDGRWVLEGDFNPIVNMPVGQLIQAGVFSIFDLSLAAARTTTAVAFVLLLIGTTFLVRRHAGALVSSWVALLVGANYFLFAYSRLAILEVVMLCFVVASLAIASSFRSADRLLIALGSSVVLAAAVLTKSTAVFALPVLMYLLSTRAQQRRRKIFLAAASGMLCLAIVATYNLLASHLYPEDFSYFKEVNFDSRLLTEPGQVVRSILRGIRHAHVVAPIAYPAALAGSAVLFAASSDFRRNRLVRLCLLWLVVYFAQLGFISYHPPRYFLPVVVPVVVLFCVGLGALRQHLNRRLALTATAALLASTIMINGRDTLAYSLAPEFSFVEMARDVGRRIHDPQDPGRAPILIGNFANSISLATGIRSVNSSVGTGDVDWRIRRYRPDYYITLGNEPAVEKVLDRHFRREKISAWNVFDNHYQNRRVLLFKLHDLSGPATR